MTEQAPIADIFDVQVRFLMKLPVLYVPTADAQSRRHRSARWSVA